MTKSYHHSRVSVSCSGIGLVLKLPLIYLFGTLSSIVTPTDHLSARISHFILGLFRHQTALSAIGHCRPYSDLTLGNWHTWMVKYTQLSLFLSAYVYAMCDISVFIAITGKYTAEIYKMVDGL